MRIQNSGNDLVIKKDDRRIALWVSNRDKREELKDYLARKSVARPASHGRLLVAELDGPTRSNDQLLDALRSNSACSLGSHVFRDQDLGTPLIPTRMLHLEIAATARRSDVTKLFERHQLNVVDVVDERTLLVETSKNSLNPVKVADALLQTKSILACEPDPIVDWQPCNLKLPADPEFPKQWHLENHGTINGSRYAQVRQGVDVGAVDAWKIMQSYGSAAITIAVIDHEFNLGQADLSHGEPLKSFSYVDGYFHGTACASLAVATANGTGGVGVAPAVKFMPIRIRTAASSEQIASAFAYAADRGADVISFSFSAPGRIGLYKHAQRRLIEILQSGRGGRGIAAFLPTGNRGSVEPDILNPMADNDDVFTVAACTSLGKHAKYSKTGTHVDFCAPAGPKFEASHGGSAFTQPGHALHTPTIRYYYGPWDGNTSGATAIAAGVGALVLSAFPELSFEKLRDVLRNTARRDIIDHSEDADTSGRSPRLGYGLINAGRALRYLANR